MTMSNTGKRSYVLKNSHGRCVVGAFDKKFTKAIFVLETELFYPLSYTNQYFLTFYTMVLNFTAYIYI